MSDHVQTCLNLFRFNMIWFVTILKYVWTCSLTRSNISKLVQIQYDANCYNYQTCLNMFKHVKTCSDSIWYELLRFSNMSEHVQTCLNLFRFIMIWIVMILKHVQTYSNMSKLGQIKYDMNCYDSQTCLCMSINMFKHV